MIEERIRIDFVYFGAGGGHKSVVLALQTVIQTQGHPWDIRLVNLSEVLESLDPLKRIVGIRVEEFYNLLLKKGWTLGYSCVTPLMNAMIWLFRNKEIALFEQFWKADPPDMVVSVMPLYNWALCKAYRRLRPKGDFVTVMTDLEDSNIWFEKQEQYFICGSEKSVQQAYAKGLQKERVFQVSGLALRPNFYHFPFIDRIEQRKALGLDPNKATALLFFGSEGSQEMIKIVQNLASSPLNLQLIVMCGRNEKLMDSFKRLNLPITCHIQGFTSEVPMFMQIADFMIGKPGAISISEAVAMQLPLIVLYNAWTLPQERYNAQWLVEKQLGMVVKSWNKISDAVRRMLVPGTLEEFRTHAAAINNRAVFEIVEILDNILNSRVK